MHFHAEIHVPKGRAPEQYVAEILAPHEESYDEATERSSGFWDWYQIGGRWTGAHSPDYDPSTDPANIEQCEQCEGTGRRIDAIGKAARAKDPEYTCNGCQGKGTRTKWPTEWTRFNGDITPVEKITDQLTCHTLLANNEVFQVEEWTGEEWKKNERFGGDVQAMLRSMGITDGMIVTVDYHC